MTDESTTVRRWGEGGVALQLRSNACALELICDDDDYYSCELSLEETFDLAATVIRQRLGMEADKMGAAPLTEEQEATIAQLRRLVPEYYMLKTSETDAFEYTFQQQLVILCDVVLSYGRAFLVPPFAQGIVLLELAAGLLRPIVDRERFLSNAALWHDSSGLSGPIVNSPGKGSA